jgi:hypothetical protein
VFAIIAHFEIYVCEVFRPCCLLAVPLPQIALLKFLDEHNNDPAVGMAMEEAVDAKLLSEEEASEILGRGADGLNWSEMLSDAARNSKLQEFLKSNRWMKRQGFVDFDAKLKELVQQHSSDLSAIEKGIRDLEEEVPQRLFHSRRSSYIYAAPKSCRVCPQAKAAAAHRGTERDRTQAGGRRLKHRVYIHARAHVWLLQKEEARIKEEIARKQAEEKMQQQMRESMRRRQRHVQKMNEAGIEICPICSKILLSRLSSTILS